MDFEYQVNPSLGTVPAPILTSNSTTVNAAGFVIVLKGAPPVLDETAFLEYPGPVVKLNTADFNLMLGGRLLLESDTGSDTSGYQLEDGSGVIILDTYIPQLGDPVTITNPTWSGRVVSVQRSPIVERQVNYVRAVVAAINTAAAPGGTAPGDFSDVAAGGYYQLEDASGNYQLEDGSGNYVLEGTTYRYRNLQLRQSQNQDGTTTTYGSLETFEGGFQAGQTFLLSNADLQLSGVSYTITNVTTSFIAIATPLYLIEFGDAYQTLQKAGGGVLTQQGSTAVVQQGAAVPAGTLAYAQVTANQGTFTAATDLTGLTVTVTVASGRRIQITGQVILASSVSNDSVLMNIVEGSTNLYQASLELGTTGGGGDTVFGQVVLQPTAGVHTYKLQGQRQSGTGNITMIAGTNQPAFIMVEDIGT